MKRLEDKLDHYQALLIKWQKSINLISPKTVSDIRHRHIEDSLQLLPLIPHDAKVICDLGSGAGFPALPIAMARPDLHVHCIESDRKKCTFLQIVSRETFCENVTIHCDRIEAVLPDLDPDLLTARALAPLEKLLGWAGQTPGLFMKGRQWEDEVKEAKASYDFSFEVHQSVIEDDSVILSVF